MLTKHNTEKFHDEIIIDTDTLCTQLEPGNPFTERRNLVFSMNKKKFEDSGSCFLPNIDRVPHKDMSSFFKDGLIKSYRRLNKHPNSRALLNSIAQNYMKNGMIDEAIEKLEQALKIDKTYFPAIANLAECFSRKGDIKKALILYKKVGEDKSKDPRVLTNIALLYLKDGNVDSAIEILEKAKKLHKNNISIFSNLGIAYLAKSEPNKAIHYFRKAAQINGDNFTIYNNLGVAFAAINNKKQALKNFKIAYSLNRTDRNVIKNIVNSYHRNNDFESIVNLLDDHLNYFPEDNELRDFMCYSFFQMKLYKRCLKELLKKLNYLEDKDSVKKASIYNNLAVVSDKLGLTSEAKEYYIKSFKLNSEPSIETFYNIIGFFFATKDIDSYKRFIDIALLQHSKTPTLLTYLGRYFSYKQDYLKAKDLYLESLRMDKNFVDPYMNLSVLECDVFENYAKAIEILKDGLSLYPNNTILLNNYAYCNILINNLSEARSILDKIGNTDDFCLNATRGLLYLKEGNLAEGRRYYNKAVLLAGKNKNNYALVNQKKHLEVAKYFIKKNEKKLALKSLEKGKKFNAMEHYYKKTIVQLYEKLINEK